MAVKLIQVSGSVSRHISVAIDQTNISR